MSKVPEGWQIIVSAFPVTEWEGVWEIRMVKYSTIRPNCAAVSTVEDAHGNGVFVVRFHRPDIAFETTVYMTPSGFFATLARAKERQRHAQHHPYQPVGKSAEPSVVAAEQSAGLHAVP